MVEGMDKHIVNTMMRFSRYGHIAVALVIIGVISAITLLPGWPLNYSGSEYQSLLWFKIILVGECFYLLSIAITSYRLLNKRAGQHPNY